MDSVAMESPQSIETTCRDHDGLVRLGLLCNISGLRGFID